MKILIAILIVACLFSCDWLDPDPECPAVGEWRCNGTVAQICNSDQEWENYQDCGAISESCSMAAGDCGGYANIACCY